MLETIFGSILSGGATGLLGVVAQRWADYKNKKLDLERERQQQEFELAKREADAKIVAAEWAARVQAAEVEAKGASDVAESNAFAASYAAEPKRYSSDAQTGAAAFLLAVADFLRAVVRPALTVYLCALTTMIYVQARGLLAKEDLDVAQALDLERLIVGTILYLTTTCVLWWFGTRNKAAPPR